jgi:flagellar hook assembly protein FlgD
MVNGACELISLVNIEIINISIPSGISPDGNGKNDALNIKGLDFSIDGATGKPNQSIELTILNSAGAQVYYTSNTDGNEWVTWEGRNSSEAELPEGTYYYLLTISSNRTTVKPEKLSGFIILKRY